MHPLIGVDEDEEARDSGRATALELEEDLERLCRPAPLMHDEREGGDSGGRGVRWDGIVSTWVGSQVVRGQMRWSGVGVVSTWIRSQVVRRGWSGGNIMSPFVSKMKIS